MPWASPSILDRVIACPASAALPQGPNITGPSAKWGKEVHAFKEGEPPTKRVWKWYSEHYPAGTVETLWPGGRHEVLYWEHRGKLEEISRKVSFEERELWPRDGMFFSLDWECLDSPVMHVDDLKTGMMPSSWTQLKAYSWAMYKKYAQDSNLASYTNWTRYPLGGEPNRVSKVFTREEIQGWYDTVVVPARRLALGPNAATLTRPGSHCRWCRSKPYCPEWANGRVPVETLGDDYGSREYQDSGNHP